MKRNLTSQSVLDRLVGQIRRFIRSYRYIIVVPCGNVSEGLLDDLQHEFRGHSGGWFPDSDTIIKIVQKRIKKKKGPKGWVDLFEEI